MKFITMVTIIIALRFQYVRATGSGILHFVNFSMPWGSDKNNCCPDGQTSNCPWQCDVHLVICIGEAAPDRNCIHGEGATSLHIDEPTDEIKFEEVLGSIPNPLVYTFNAWEQGVMVEADVFIGESTLVDIIKFNLNTKPQPNGQVIHVGPQLFSGHMTSVTVDHSVSCDPLYYGDCTTFCLPDPALYTCDLDGSKQCLPDINCGSEFSHERRPSKGQKEDSGSSTSFSTDFTGSTADTLYSKEYSRTLPGSPSVNSLDIQELSTTGRNSPEMTSSIFDINENIASKGNSLSSSEQYGLTLSQQYIGPTTTFVFVAPEVATSEMHEITNARETVLGETRTTEEMSTEIEDGTFPDTFIDTTADSSIPSTDPSFIDNETTDNSVPSTDPSFIDTTADSSEPSTTPSFTDNETTDNSVPSTTSSFIDNETTDNSVPSTDPSFIDNETTNNSIPSTDPSFIDTTADSSVPSTTPSFIDNETRNNSVPSTTPSFTDNETTDNSVSMETFTSTTARDKSVSTVSPSKADTSTISEPHVCTGDINVSAENTGMLEHTVSQHATDSNVDFASHRSSPNTELSTIPEHDLLTSSTNTDLPVSSYQSHVDSSSSRSDVDVESPSSTTTDDYSTTEITLDTDVTYLTETRSPVSASFTKNNDVLLTTSSDRKLSSETTTPMTFNTIDVTSLDTYSVTSISGSVTKQTTDELVSSEEPDSSPFITAIETVATVLQTKTDLNTKIVSVTHPVTLTPPTKSSLSNTRVTPSGNFITSAENNLPYYEHSTEQSHVSTEEYNLSITDDTTTNRETSTEKPISYDITSTERMVLTSEKSNPTDDLISTTIATFNVNTTAKTNITNITENPRTVRSESATIDNSPPFTSLNPDISQKITTRQTAAVTTPNQSDVSSNQQSETSGDIVTAMGSTDRPQSPKTYPTEQFVHSTEIFTKTYNSHVTASPSTNVATKQVTKELPEYFTPNLSLTTKETSLTSSSQTEQDTAPSRSTALIHTSPMSRIGTTTHSFSSSCRPAVVYSSSEEAVLTVQISNGGQSVSMVTIENEVVQLLVSTGYKVDTKVKAIKTSTDGLTFVNVTINTAGQTLGDVVLTDVGHKLCDKATMFLVQPPSPVHLEETTDGGNAVLAGVLVLVAYLTTLFIIAVILVRRKYHEMNKISERPLSEVSKVSRTSELLLCRPETGMTGLSSEYGESLC